MTNGSSLKFSVIITVHNHRRYVLETINSVLVQTWPAMEIVIVNDGSTDGSDEELAAAGLPPKCRVISQANGGQLSAFCTGVRETHGDVVCLLDSDDVWTPDYLEQLAQIYQSQKKVDFVLSDIVLFGSKDGLHGQFAAARDCGRTMLVTRFDNFWENAPTSAMSLRRNLLMRVLDAPEDMIARWRIAADAYVNIGACVLGAWKYYLPTGAVRYRMHEHNHWAGKESATSRHRYWVDTRSTRNFFGERMHLSLDHLNELKSEFMTHPTPCREDFRRYAKLNWKTPTSWAVRIERWFSMYKHYLRNRRPELPAHRVFLKERQ